MNKCVWYLLVVVLCLIIMWGRGEMVWGAREIAPEQTRQVRGSNLLVNGNFEELGFYHKPPNHFVGEGWLRWIIEPGIPEYDDVRPGRLIQYDGDHAQVYHRWMKPYTAGIYQQVAAQPCTFYRFDMYGRNHSLPGADHHARIGIDPLGGVYNSIDDPFVDSLPAEVVWSPEQTYFQVWGLHTVTTESRSNYVTAITYASPDPGYGYYDTFWDAGTLVEVRPPGGKLPPPTYFAPDGFVANLTTTNIVNYLIVEWDTPQPASTQVWYSIVEPDAPYTPTVPYGSVMYLPQVFRSFPAVFQPQFFTPAEQAPVIRHRAIIGPFQNGQIVRFAALSRRLVGAECQTATSGVIQQTVAISEPFYRLHIPLTMRSEP